MVKDFPSLHPIVIHFPIALLLLAGILGAISLFTKKEFWKDLAFKSLLVGVIFTPFAVITGLIDEQSMGHDSVDPMLSFHKYNGLALMFFYQILALWFWLRKKLPGNREYLAWVICLFLGSCMVMMQGYLGGEMVFAKGMGVKPVEELGMGHHGGKMEMDSSSKMNEEHSDNGHEHDEGSMKDMPGMDKKDMKGMDNMKDMPGMDKKHMKGMDNMKGMKLIDNKIMKGMENMKDMPGMDKKDMKGMDNMKGMKGMDNKNMKGMENMKDMPGMDKKDMKGMDSMKDMKGMDNMKDPGNMKDMRGMDNMKSMKGMDDMKGMKLIDNSKPVENNPAIKKENQPKRQQ